jgi:hypothetical protein
MLAPLGRLGGVLVRSLVRPEAFAFRSELRVIDEEVERLRPDDITSQ